MILGQKCDFRNNEKMDYQGIRDKINDVKKIVKEFKDETPQIVLEVSYFMFDKFSARG